MGKIGDYISGVGKRIDADVAAAKRGVQAFRTAYPDRGGVMHDTTRTFTRRLAASKAASDSTMQRLTRPVNEAVARVAKRLTPPKRTARH